MYGTFEITGDSIGKEIKFKPGQFAFLKILDNENGFVSHPFTISEAPKTGELQLLNSNNLRVHLFNSKEKGFLSVNEISKFVNTKDSIDVYFCGPALMRENLKKQFKDSNFNIINFNYEHFQFK